MSSMVFGLMITRMRYSLSYPYLTPGVLHELRNTEPKFPCCLPTPPSPSSISCVARCTHAHRFSFSFLSPIFFSVYYFVSLGSEERDTVVSCSSVNRGVASFFGRVTFTIRLNFVIGVDGQSMTVGLGRCRIRTTGSGSDSGETTTIEIRVMLGPKMDANQHSVVFSFLAATKSRFFSLT